MTKEKLTEDIIRKLGLLSFLINEVDTSLKYSSPTSSESPGFITMNGEIYRLWDTYRGNVSFITDTWTTIKAKH